MYQRYYDGYPIQETVDDNASILCEVQPQSEIASKPGKVFASFKIDDVLLLGILIVMLSDDCDDKLMIIIIGYLFLSGLK